MDNNKHNRLPPVVHVALPRAARLPMNRCNLPADILGGLTFQAHPTTLEIDGVKALHHQLFNALEQLAERTERVALFKTHMAASFQLMHPEEIGFDRDSEHPGRPRIDYLKLLRGWMFDSHSREGAVMKGWVESRFGLLPRAHLEPLRDYASAAYQRFCHARACGLHNTNALEAQLDLLYAFCQHELRRQHPNRHRIALYRGIDHIGDYELIDDSDPRQPVLLLNNLSSFTDSAERAGEFGDQVFVTEVPLAKLLFFPGLLPGALGGEQEFLVVGGLYRVRQIDV